MPANKRQIRLFFLVLFSLAILAQLARAEQTRRYHTGKPGSHFIVMSLISVLTEGENTREVDIETDFGEGYITYNGELMISSDHIPRIIKFLNRRNDQGLPLDIPENSVPAVKLFSRMHPMGFGYIRSIGIDKNKITVVKCCVAKLHLNEKVHTKKTIPVEVPYQDLSDYTFGFFRPHRFSKDFSEAGGNVKTTLLFQYDFEEGLCNGYHCQNNQTTFDVSFRPVFAINKNIPRIFLYGFTRNCRDRPQCSIQEVKLNSRDLEALDQFLKTQVEANLDVSEPGTLYLDSPKDYCPQEADGLCQHSL